MGKGLILTGVTVFAFFSAIEAILAGGRPIAAGLGLWYAVIAATGCAVLSIVERRLAKHCGSPIVALDAKNWLIDSLISGTVALAFGFVMIISTTPLAWFIPYADPALVIVLVIATIAVPIEAVRRNWAQIIGKAPEPNFQHQIRQIVETSLTKFPYVQYHLRQGRMGRLVYVQVYLQVSSDMRLGPSQVDRLRSQLYSALQQAFPYLAMDMIVTTQPIWIRRAIMPTAPPPNV